MTDPLGGLPAALNRKQWRRAEALRIARDVLASRTAMSSSLGTRSGGELVYLAEWIVYGPSADLELAEEDGKHDQGEDDQDHDDKDTLDAHADSVPPATVQAAYLALVTSLQPPEGGHHGSPVF